VTDLPDTNPDAQDMAEVFDEDTTNTELQQLMGPDSAEQAEDMVDNYDVTTAIGDSDDDDALIAEDLDDDEIIALAEGDDDDDLEDDETAERDPERLYHEGDLDRIEDMGPDDADLVDNIDTPGATDAPLVYAGDMTTAAHARSAAQPFESKTLSDTDLAALDYRKT
jgi:hypothetical protein